LGPQQQELKELHISPIGFKSIPCLQEIYLGGNDIGDDLTYRIGEIIQENLLRKEINNRKFICAFNEYHIRLHRLRSDKMILKFVYFPIIGIILDD
jgi:hypothetical protein